MNPAAQPAIDAFNDFWSALRNAQRRPRALGGPMRPEADFAKYAYIPLLNDMNTYTLGLWEQRVAFRGVAPRPRVSVISVDLTAKPYPIVVLSNCPTSEAGWQEYIVATGKTVPNVPTRVPPPYRARVEVIYIAKRWLVRKIDNDTSRTCTA